MLSSCRGGVKSVDEDYSLSSGGETEAINGVEFDD
jgi:hypothetical protein